MNDSKANTNNQQVLDIVIKIPEQNPPTCMGFDDDGRVKRTGTVWTASAHITTAVIGSGVLSLAWAVAQLGWVVGPTVMLLFSFIAYYTSTLLAYCYRSGDPLFGKRNYTYTDVVRSNLGSVHVKLCGVIQYVNLIGIAIGYTIVSSVSMMAIKRSKCFHKSGGKNPCHMSSNPYMIGFGIVQIIFSQIPDFSQIWWLSIVAAIMSFTYSSIGFGLGIAQVANNKFNIKGSLTGVKIGASGITQMQKTWSILQAVGNIAFAYSFSFVLVEIQDTIKSPPSESKTMKKASRISITLTTIFYMMCGCMGYAAFGDQAPGNLLSGFGLSNPYWLIDIANVAIVIHLVGAYQLFVQPVFAFIEKWVSDSWPENEFFTKEIKITSRYNLNLFRLVWRSVFVTVITLVSMLLPFFNDIVGLLGSLGFWPLTVYFPIEMYIVQKKVPKWSTKWVFLQLLNLVCLVICIGSAVGSIVGVFLDLKVYHIFKSS